MGPTPNSGRPVEPAARRPVRGSRACTPIPLFRSARDEHRHARDRARVQRTARRGATNSDRRIRIGHRSDAAVRQSAPMTTRRDHRQTHVRPRPPSTGRPAPVKVKPRAPGPTRLSGHRPIKRNGGLPIDLPRSAWSRQSSRSVVGVLYLGAGGLGSRGRRDRLDARWVRHRRHLDAVAEADGRRRSPIRRRSQQPSEPYTSEPTVDLVVTVPAGVGGDQAYRIRVYLALPDQAPTADPGAPLAAAAKTVIPGSS